MQKVFRKNQMAARLKQTPEIAKRCRVAVVVDDMVKHVNAGDCVEGTLGERKLLLADVHAYAGNSGKAAVQCANGCVGEVRPGDVAHAEPLPIVDGKSASGADVQNAAVGRNELRRILLKAARLDAVRPSDERIAQPSITYGVERDVRAEALLPVSAFGVRINHRTKRTDEPQRYATASRWPGGGHLVLADFHGRRRPRQRRTQRDRDHPRKAIRSQS